MTFDISMKWIQKPHGNFKRNAQGKSDLHIVQARKSTIPVNDDWEFQRRIASFVYVFDPFFVRDVLSFFIGLVVGG